MRETGFKCFKTIRVLVPDFMIYFNDSQVWYAAVTQCFFSLSVGFGPIIMNASYNGFRHRIYRYVILNGIPFIIEKFSSLIILNKTGMPRS
jgi:SNF family Na+-dependent transporter